MSRRTALHRVGPTKDITDRPEEMQWDENEVQLLLRTIHQLNPHTRVVEINNFLNLTISYEKWTDFELTCRPEESIPLWLSIQP